MSEDFEPVTIRVFASPDGRYRFCDGKRAKLDASGVSFETKADATRAGIEAARAEGHDIEYIIGDGVSKYVAHKLGVKLHRSVKDDC